MALKNLSQENCSYLNQQLIIPLKFINTFRLINILYRNLPFWEASLAILGTFGFIRLKLYDFLIISFFFLLT